MQQSNAGAASAVTDATTKPAETQGDDDGASSSQQPAAKDTKGSASAKATADSSAGEEEPIGSEDLDLAGHLNLPPGAMAEIRKTAKPDDPPSRKATADSSRRASGEEGPANAAASADVEATADSSAGEEEGEESAAAEAMADSSDNEEEEGDREEADDEPLPRDVRKLQKRVARLTKKLRDRDRALEAYEGNREQDRMAALNGDHQRKMSPHPGGILGSARTEQQLDHMVNEAEGLIQLVEDYPDGWTEGEGEKAVFHEPNEMKAWKREAEKIVRGEPMQRRQIREFQSNRQTFNNAVMAKMPELFHDGRGDEPVSKEYKAGLLIVQEYPFLKQHPAGNYAIMMMLKGYKADTAESKASSIRNDEDLDPRLDPEHQRTHIPPTTRRPALNPPGRTDQSRNGGNAVPKKVEAAVEKFTQPGGATTAGLASILENLDESETDPSKRRVAV